MNGEHKITSSHRERAALIYLRQSSMAQVREHTESTRSQYALADTVFVCSGGVSGQITLPRGWTDRGEPPLGRRLSAEGLAGLDTLARSLRGR